MRAARMGGSMPPAPNPPLTRPPPSPGPGAARRGREAPPPAGAPHARARSGPTATTTPTAAACAIGSIEPAGEGDPLLNKAVITYTGIPFWHFNVGILEPALMFEGTTSSASLMFLERP